MKRVTIVIANITKTGGTERSTINTANMLVGLGHQVQVLSLERNDSGCSYPCHESILFSSLNLGAIPQNIFSKLLYYNKCLRRMRRFFKQEQTDIVMGTGHQINFLLPLVIKKTQCKILACEHIAHSSLNFFSNVVRRIMYRFVDLVVVLTKNAELKFSYTKVKRIPNALSFYPEFPAALNKRTILSVGRISAEKGFDRLLLVASKVKEHFPDWRFKIVGSGPLEVALFEQRNKLLLNDYVGIFPFTKEIEKEYLESSIYAMTSYTEAFPMVLLEAKACGLPAICFNYGDEVKDIIQDNVNGFLIDNNDINKYSDAICRLIGDKTLMKNMGVEARKSALIYSKENVQALWNEVIREVSKK